MSASKRPAGYNPTARSRITAAIATVLPFNLPDAFQNTPKRPKALQTTPSTTSAQNEATGQSVPPLTRSTLPIPPPLKYNKLPNEPNSSSESAPNHAKAPQRAPQISTPRKTNPPPKRPPRPLTPNQLKAARLLVAGHSTNAIAASLHIDRHTLADWKRHPLFQQEIRRLIDTQ